MSYVLPYASRSVSRGGCSIPVRGPLRIEDELIHALDYLYSKGIVINRFHMTATTTGASETVSIARLTTYYNTTIDWGDGSAPETLVANVTTARTHVYATAGTYPIVVNHAHLITQLRVEDAKLGGINTAELKYSVLTYFWVTLATGCTINSADMVDWRPTTWRLYSMPAGTYDIDSADMVDWRPAHWYLYSMPAGTYDIDSTDMVDWRPTTWRLQSMPAGTYDIDSTDMVNWRPANWYLYSMPAGTYDIDSTDMVDWRPTYWWLHSMPAGTYDIDSTDMVNWRPADWRLYSMPAAGSSYSFAASCMRNWTDISTLKLENMGLPDATVDAILMDIYAGLAGFTAAAPTLTIGGTNEAPSGTYQAPTGPGGTPTSGLEAVWIMTHNTGHTWTVAATGGSYP